jgi:hypothetical protein
MDPDATVGLEPRIVSRRNELDRDRAFPGDTRLAGIVVIVGFGPLPGTVAAISAAADPDNPGWALLVTVTSDSTGNARWEADKL